MQYRKATMKDVETIHKIINSYADERLMLARSRNMIYEGLRDFTVAEKDGQFFGAGGLHIVWEDLAEIRALAIVPTAVKTGIGQGLVKNLIAEAKELGIKKIFSLTYQPGFFVKCGFEIVDKDKLPQKVWKECINCPQFPDCNETAVWLEL